MKKYIIGIFALMAILAFTAACTQNQRARHWGGTTAIELEPNQKVVNATWKEGNDLWILLRPMHDDEKPETLTFKEKSSLGMFEGKIMLVESRR